MQLIESFCRNLKDREIREKNIGRRGYGLGGGRSEGEGEAEGGHSVGDTLLMSPWKQFIHV